MRRLGARRRTWAAGVLVAGALLLGGCARSRSTPGPSDVAPRTDPTAEDVKTVETHDAGAGQWAGHTGPGMLRTHGDASLTGRLGASMPGGSWSVAAKAPVDDEAGIRAVLTAGDRIVVQTDEGWALFDDALRPVGVGPAAAGVLVLDPAQHLLWSPDPTGSLRAASLRDGAEAYVVPSAFGGGFERRLLVRRGGTLIVGGVAAGPETHGGPASSGAFLEVIELGDPGAVDPMKLLESAVTAAERRVDTRVFAAAVGDGVIAMAEPEGVVLLDLRLEPRGGRVPVRSVSALSLDERGDVHVVSEQAGTWTYGLVHGGRAVAQRAVASPLGRRIRPPVVAADHRVYLVGDDRLGVFDPGVRPVGEWAVGARVSGAMIGGDGSLLVGAGHEILAFDRDGTRSVLHDFGREQVRTAPVLDAKGRLLVATTASVYVLVAR